MGEQAAGCREYSPPDAAEADAPVVHNADGASGGRQVHCLEEGGLVEVVNDLSIQSPLVVGIGCTGRTSSQTLLPRRQERSYANTHHRPSSVDFCLQDTCPQRAGSPRRCSGAPPSPSRGRGPGATMSDEVHVYEAAVTALCCFTHTRNFTTASAHVCEMK